jgi:hypothetical protein
MLFFIASALLLVIGWLIKHKKVMWLISGYNTSSPQEKEEYDPEKLRRYFGNFVFVLACIMMIMAAASVIFFEYEDTVTYIGFGALSIAIISGIIFLNTNNRVKRT